MLKSPHKLLSENDNLSKRILYIPFQGISRIASWAIHRGGITEADGVTWLRVSSEDIQPPIEPAEYLKNVLHSQGLTNTVGLMTSAKLENASSVKKHFGDLWVSSTATVGLGNSMRIGDPPSPPGHIGTINISSEVSIPLSDEALLEGLSMMTEAKTAAMYQNRLLSYLTGKRATGTGTDCSVIACPIESKHHIYCGKHTSIGHLIGATVFGAVSLGIQKWKSDNPNHILIEGN